MRRATPCPPGPRGRSQPPEQPQQFSAAPSLHWAQPPPSIRVSVSVSPALSARFCAASSWRLPDLEQFPHL
eukprot:1295165-Lingulodinium_polyedra.AAC.1